jgi:hypothetical protein
MSNIDTILNEYGEFISIPTELLVNPRYNKTGESGRLRHNSVILYGVLLYLSEKQKNKDEDGRAYVTITGDKIADIVGTTTGSVPTNMLKQLEEFNLIERGPIQVGKPNKIYIKSISR